MSLIQEAEQRSEEFNSGKHLWHESRNLIDSIPASKIEKSTWFGLGRKTVPLRAAGIETIYEFDGKKIDLRLREDNISVFKNYDFILQLGTASDVRETFTVIESSGMIRSFLNHGMEPRTIYDNDQIKELIDLVENLKRQSDSLRPIYIPLY